MGLWARDRWVWDGELWWSCFEFAAWTAEEFGLGFDVLVEGGYALFFDFDGCGFDGRCFCGAGVWSRVLHFYI